MKTKQEILESIATDKKYIAYCKKVAGNGEMYQDLYQHAFEEIASKEEAVLVDIATRDFGKYYAGMVYKLYNNYNSSFFRMYKKNKTICFNESFVNDDGFNPSKEDMENVLKSYESEIDFNSDKLYYCIIDEIKKLASEHQDNYYIAKLFLKYIKLGSYRKLEQETGVQFTSIYLMLNKFKEEIIKRVWSKYYL